MNDDEAQNTRMDFSVLVKKTLEEFGANIKANSETVANS